MCYDTHNGYVVATDSTKKVRENYKDNGCCDLCMDDDGVNELENKLKKGELHVTKGDALNENMFKILKYKVHKCKRCTYNICVGCIGTYASQTCPMCKVEKFMGDDFDGLISANGWF